VKFVQNYTKQLTLDAVTTNSKLQEKFLMQHFGYVQQVAVKLVQKL